MAWLLRSPSPNPISALLGAEGTSLVQVIGDPNFPQALRVPTVQLCEFLTREDRIDELFDWILTDIHGNDENAEDIATKAVQAIAGAGFSLQGSFIEQPRFSERLKAFPQSKEASSSKFCGCFCRIVEPFVKFTRGKLLQDIPEICDFIINKRQCLAVSHLFIELAAIFQGAMGITEQTFLKLAEDLRSPDAVYAAAALHEATTKVTLLQFMTNVDFIGKLLEVAVDETTIPGVACECFKAVDLLLRHSTEKKLREKVNEFERTYKFQDDCRIVYSTQLFNRRAVDVIDLMFLRPPRTLVNANILQSFLCLPLDEQVRIAVEKDLPHAVMKCLRESRVNGHVMRLGGQLARIPEEKQTGCLTAEDWREFVTKELEPGLLLLDQSVVVSQGVSAEQLTSLDCTDPKGIFDDSSSDDGEYLDDDLVSV